MRTLNRLTDTQSSPSNTVSDRADPCKLGLVDGEVRATGPLESLFVEDFVRGTWGQGLCLNRPDKQIVCKSSNPVVSRSCAKSLTVSRWSSGRPGSELNTPR